MSFTTNYEVTNNLNAWKSAHEANIKEATENLSNPNLDQEESLAQYFAKQDQIGTDFDFMQDKDATNPEEYQEALDILGKGEVESMDLNSDGVISREEYMANELNGVEDDLKQKTATTAYLMFDVIDQAMGNGDGAISSDEFARFYKNMDGFECKGDLEYGLSDNYDGKIDLDLSGIFINWAVKNIFDRSTIKATSNLLAKNPEYVDRLSTIQDEYRDYIEEKIQASVND